jgi:archaellum component FlaF (FlaF/FlaG flagellin family)
MLTNDLTIVSNRASVTLPGADASTVYALLPQSKPGTVSRRVAGTQYTSPKELHITQQTTKSGTVEQRQRTVVRAEYSEKSGQIIPLGQTKVLVPGCAVTITIDRPSAPEAAAAITDAEVKTMLGVAFDAANQNIAALLNGEA